MDDSRIVLDIRKNFSDIASLDIREAYRDEVHVEAGRADFGKVCLGLHKMFRAPVMMQFCADERQRRQSFAIRCVFLCQKQAKWIVVTHHVPQDDPVFPSLARSIYSASWFEREIYEMFGIKPDGHPDLRRLVLHDEVWPEGQYPLRKEAAAPQAPGRGTYLFSRVEGEGVFEVPVGPVHAGIIGPGHFRFSVAGEPVINLELRLGFTHRGAEKHFEGKNAAEAIRLAEVVSGDASFAHSLAFARAAEKIGQIVVPRQAEYVRAVFLELERLYNHVNDIGGIAVDVAFSFPAALAAIIKENLLQLNENLSASRYLRKVNVVGGVAFGLNETKKALLLEAMDRSERDFNSLVQMLEGSVSFMDRVDTTGVLRRKTAEDIGIVGLPARASGIGADLRAVFGGVYDEARFKMAVEQSGDVLARLRVRFTEFRESIRLIRVFAAKLDAGQELCAAATPAEGAGIGFAEGWRGPVLYWLGTDAAGVVERCKIVDPSFHNWPGLSFAVLGNIIPDFPVCNKSFDLSYSGNDL